MINSIKQYKIGDSPHFEQWIIETDEKTIEHIKENQSTMNYLHGIKIGSFIPRIRQIKLLGKVSEIKNSQKKHISTVDIVDSNKGKWVTDAIAVGSKWVGDITKDGHPKIYQRFSSTHKHANSIIDKIKSDYIIILKINKIAL